MIRKMNVKINRKMELNIKYPESKKAIVLSAFFMNDSGFPVLFTSLDCCSYEALVGEAVVFHRESHHNEVNAAR